MSIGSGLAAAVNGFIDGRQVKHGWEDRKIDQKRQTRLDELREAAEVRAEESHDLDMETGGLMNSVRRQAVRAGDREWDDQNQYRAAVDADLALAEKAMRAPDLSAQLDPATVSTSGGGGLLAQQIADAQRAATAPALGAVHPAADDRGQAIAEHRAGQAAPAAAPGGGLGAVRPAATDDSAQAVAQHRAEMDAWSKANRPRPPASTGYVDLLRVRPDGMFIANRAPQTDDEKRALLEAAKAGKLATSPEREAQQREIDANTALDMPYDWGAQGNLVGDLDRVGRLGQRAANDTLARAGEMAVNGAVSGIQNLNSPLQAVSRYATGEDHIGAPQRVDLNSDGKRESTATPIAESWGAIRAEPQPKAKAAAPAPKHAPAAAGDAAPESAKVVASTAAKVVDAVAESQPAVKAAIEAVPAKDLGVSRSKPMTAPQREKAGRTLMESYVATGAPNVTRELIRQGRLEDAKKFDAWVKDSRAADGMAAWGRGIFAALQGDADSAAESFMDAYNASGYFNDGMDVVKDKSTLIKNDAGDVVGVTLTMRNQATGEEITQTDSIDGFIQKAAWITSPEKAFESSQARLAAQQEALLKAEEERRKSATKLVEDNYTQTISLARDMFAKSQAQAKEAREAAMLTGEADSAAPAMTWDEAFREAQRIMVDGPSAPQQEAEAGAPPVARRPQ